MKHSLFSGFLKHRLNLQGFGHCCIFFLPPFPHAHRIKDPSNKSPYFISSSPQTKSSVSNIQTNIFKTLKSQSKLNMIGCFFPIKILGIFLFRHNIVCTLSRNIWLEPPLMKPKLIHYESEYKMLFLKKILLLYLLPLFAILSKSCSAIQP